MNDRGQEYIDKLEAKIERLREECAKRERQILKLLTKIERLRDALDYWENSQQAEDIERLREEHAGLAQVAADEIVRLREELGRWKTSHKSINAHCKDLLCDKGSLRAENKRLLDHSRIHGERYRLLEADNEWFREVVIPNKNIEIVRLTDALATSVDLNEGEREYLLAAMDMRLWPEDAETAMDIDALIAKLKEKP